jgi:hypothetical protein
MPTQNLSYSRKSKVEEKRNIRKAILFIFLTIGILVLFILYGFGALAKFAVFLGELKKGGQPVESNDQTPPIPPRFEPIPKATNEQELEIKGSTEPGATVILTVNGEDHDLLANNEGEFRYAADLLEGENIISAFSQDNAGNKNNAVQTLIVIYDHEAPKLELSKPQDGSSFYGSKERQLIIEGETDKETKVNVNGRHVVVESSGKFTFLTTLSEGENKLTIKAEDEAGNNTEKIVTVTYSP